MPPMLVGPLGCADEAENWGCTRRALKCRGRPYRLSFTPAFYVSQERKRFLRTEFLGDRCTKPCDNRRDTVAGGRCDRACPCRERPSVCVKWLTAGCGRWRPVRWTAASSYHENAASECGRWMLDLCLSDDRCWTASSIRLLATRILHRLAAKSVPW